MDLIIDGNDLVVRLAGLEKLAAFRWTDLRIPRSAIVRADKTLPESSWKQLRVAGTHIPGWLKAGSYYASAGWEFWYVAFHRRPEPLTLTLNGEKIGRVAFAKVVLGVSDTALVDRIVAWC